MNKNEICFDMDGTFVDFYAVDGWLDDLIHFNPRPYNVAKPLINMSIFARYLNNLQKKGYRLKIISWSSKAHNDNFDALVKTAKEKWLKHHLPSVTFDEIHILPYGTPKENYGEGYLFDDEQPNRDNWNGTAFDETHIFDTLRDLINGKSI